MRHLIVAALLTAVAALGPSQLAGQSTGDARRVVTLWTTTNAVARPYILEIEAVLLERGWTRGRTIRFDHYFTDGRPELLLDMAREIVASRPDVIYTAINTGAFAVKR